jgi:serine/threonine protein kinase/tetratricopeptide (TPR) repeat protein
MLSRLLFCEALLALDTIARLNTSLVGRYRIERELGAGGMATVYLAEDFKHDRHVALKVLREDLSASLGKERFVREVKVAAALQHPHILPLYDSGEADGLLFYVMPFVDGQSLREKLVKEGELSVNDAVRVLRDVADALSEAHKHGVVHRDLKPENVMLRGRHALVTDFGVAKALSDATGAHSLTTAGIALGTPTYMSPEQATADPHLDQRADIYAFGVIAYELLTGRPPFSGSSPQQTLAAHVTVTPEPVTAHRATIPPALASLVMRCLEKNPADRWQHAEDLIPPLEAVLTSTGGATPTDARPLAPASAPVWRRNVQRLTTAVLGLALIAVLALYWRLRGDSGAAPIASPSIAVLPFSDMSDTKADESFTDGMTEELVGALSNTEGLRVKSAFSLRGTQKAEREIGRQLEVQSVVAGSVRRSGDVLRISARLVNVSDGYQLWANTYERAVRNPADVFTVQDDITKAIVNALKLKLNVATTAAAQGDRQTKNFDAYKAFLNGRYYMAKRTGESLRTAIGFFEDAVRRDSTYAIAWDGLADSYALINNYAFVSHAEVFGKARQAVQRALALDSTLAEAYATVGYIGLNDSWNWPAVEKAFQRSIVLNPNVSTAHHWYSLYLDAMGRGPEALSEIRRAIELDPVSLVINREEGTTYYYLRDYAKALQQYRRTLDLDPSFVSAHVWIARAYIAQRKFGDAINELRNQPDYQGGHSFAILAYAYAHAGQREKADSLLEELTARARRENVWPMYLGLIQLALGNRDAALSYLESEVDRHSAQMAYIRVDPIFAELKGNVRFERILRKLNLTK